jgi:peptidase E
MLALLEFALLLLLGILRSASCGSFVASKASSRSKIRTVGHHGPPGLVTLRTEKANTEDTKIVMEPAIGTESSMWMREGLLISSFSDGLVPNLQARHYLRKGLLRCLLTEQQQAAELTLEASVLFSPCNGPNMEAMHCLELCDRALQQLKTDSVSCSSDGVLQQAALSDNETSHLRFVYIPTAMYALRPESTNTPGKQRQRARADGKQRRDEIVRLLQELLGANTTTIDSVTLDLDDGSIKQPETTNAAAAAVKFPASGKEALRDWKPHFVYVQGGNTFWLYHCMEKGEWKNDLLQLLRGSTTLYCGASAGAIIAGASMETACWKGWDNPSVVAGRETYDDWKGVAGLSLVDKTAFFPHHVEAQWSNVVADNGSELKDRTGVATCCLRDEQVCYVDGASGKAILL